MTLSSRDLIEMDILVESGTTRGRTFRLCGAMGAMMRTFESGEQIGPPTLREYAVEPELVATNRPSAQYVGSLFPSRATSMPRRAAPDLWTQISFRVYGEKALPDPSTLPLISV
jgi:hypothetical protein